MTNYPLGDFLIRIKNIGLAGKRTLVVDKTKLIYEVAKVLKKQAILEEVKEVGSNLEITLRYHKKKPVLMDLSLVSTPGLRVYARASEIKSKRGAEFYIISTPLGILSSSEAIKKNVGGEVIVKIL